MNCLRQPSPEGDLRRVNSVLALREGHAFGIEGRLDRLLGECFGKRQAGLLEQRREDQGKPMWQRTARCGK